MRESILDIIRQITAEKKEKNLSPSAATYTEISTRLHQQVQNTLNEMVKDGTLKWNRTINSVSFEINENK